jgi:hypothetical protein
MPKVLSVADDRRRRHPRAHPGSHPPGQHTEYRLRHPATPFYAASTSPIAVVRVGVRLTARSNRTSMALGRTATISGQVIPAHRGQRIRLQHKQGRTWRTTQSKPLPACGRYSFNLRPRATGTSWWRVYKASDTDHIGAISATFRLVVYRAAITGIHADAAGDDRRNLNGEYALVRNTGAAAINLSGWKLDAGDRSQRFTLASYPSRRAPPCGSTPAAGQPEPVICTSGRVDRSGTTTATPPPSSTPTTPP